ncbi:tRNA dihydrouridine synthase DusB [Spiroplasma endosymbiont of Labia minor]|uniref:tRNA dihydrouridine synthase DusB n=1 Tax=Spiroplasma endosymbiont of Labia minor TaxID=3066305 RepID=UPI0030CD5DF3
MKIGNVEIKGKLILGPMAGTTNEAFRIIAKEKGASLVYAEMVSSEGLIHNNKKTFEMINIENIEHPATLQIFGYNVNSFVEAAKLVDKESECDIVDINMGCPVPKVAIKSQAGANLLKFPDKVFEVVKSVVNNTTKPVTVKMRIGWDEQSKNCVELAKICEKAGAKAIALHARTRSQFYTGKADWSWIRKIKQAVSIPVIGNGDVIDGISAKAMFDETGCDAIMIARAAQGNPWIFEQINYYLETGQELEKPTFSEWRKTVLRHAELLITKRGQELGIKEMRKQLLWYLNVLEKNKNILEMKKMITSINTIVELNNVIDMYNN